MNKAELVQALAERLDADRRVAAAAVDGLLDVIVRAVHEGDSVSVVGFGVFERRERAARTARNPRTGQLIEVPATAVPAFRPGATFRDVVSGARTLGEPAAPQPAAPRVAARPAPVNGSSVNGVLAPVPTASALALATEPTSAAEAATPAKVKDAKAAPAKKSKAVPESGEAKAIRKPKDVKANKPKDAKAAKGKKKPKK